MSVAPLTAFLCAAGLQPAAAARFAEEEYALQDLRGLAPEQLGAIGRELGLKAGAVLTLQRAFRLPATPSRVEALRGVRAALQALKHADAAERAVVGASPESALARKLIAEALPAFAALDAAGASPPSSSVNRCADLRAAANSGPAAQRCGSEAWSAAIHARFPARDRRGVAAFAMAMQYLRVNSASAGDDFALAGALLPRVLAYVSRGWFEERRRGSAESGVRESAARRDSLVPRPRAPRTPPRDLGRAARKGQLSAVRWLLAQGASPVARSATGARATAGTVATLVASRTTSSRLSTSGFHPSAVSGRRGLLVVPCAFKGGYRGARAVD